jgi:hypothetical protein
VFLHLVTCVIMFVSCKSGLVIAIVGRYVCMYNDKEVANGASANAHFSGNQAAFPHHWGYIPVPLLRDTKHVSVFLFVFLGS